MRRKRVLINIHYLEIGGAETSLIGLLRALDPRRVDVDLLLNAHRGEMMRFIPDWVNILPEIPEYSMVERPIVDVVKHGFYQIAFARLIAKLMHKVYMWRSHPVDGSAIFGYVAKFVTPLLPSLQHTREYDLAISFLTPHNIVLDKVQAGKKACWIHTDYSKIDVNRNLELPVWSGYDRVVSISSDVTSSFLSVFPSLCDRVTEIENILLPKFIRERADDCPSVFEMVKSGNEQMLLTVGRYSYQKRLEAIPVICRRLVDNGHDVKWYIIGYGSDDGYIREAIAREGMEERVILLGKRSTPYPYIKACDWYVQPSRYEGKSVVVREAQILGKPVIITAYPTSSSQIKDRVDGVIVPMDVEACAEAMSGIIADGELKKCITDYLSMHDYGNESEVEKIYNLIP